MNRRAVTLILLAIGAAAAGIGALVRNGRDPRANSTLPAAAKSPQREAENGFSKEKEKAAPLAVDPATRRLADELVEFATDWQKQHPGAQGEEWSEAAFKKLCELDTNSLLALASMTVEVHWEPSFGESFQLPPFFGNFGDTLLPALGAKDFERARSFSLAQPPRTEEDRPFISGENLFCGDAIAGLRKGLMRVDSAAAWAHYLRDGQESSPFSSEYDSSALMVIHAKQDPDAAWQFILDVSGQGRLEKGMLEGYLRAAPERDWEPLARELAERLRQTPTHDDRALHRLLAAGWAERQPREALAWYFAETKGLPPATNDSGVDQTEAETFELLSTIPRLPAAVERMARSGCADLAELVISNHFSRAEGWVNLPLVDSIPLLPSPGTRAALLEQAAQTISPLVAPHKVGWTPRELDDALARLTRAADRSELSPEERERVDASIRALEERRPFARKER